MALYARLKPINHAESLWHLFLECESNQLLLALMSTPENCLKLENLTQKSKIFDST